MSKSSSSVICAILCNSVLSSAIPLCGSRCEIPWCRMSSVCVESDVPKSGCGLEVKLIAGARGPLGA